MTDILRESPFGQTVRWLTRTKYLQYPEEVPGFTPPWESNARREKSISSGSEKPEDHDIPDHEFKEETTLESPVEEAEPQEAIESFIPAMERRTTEPDLEEMPENYATRTKTRESTIPYSEDRFEVEQRLAQERSTGAIIIPTKTDEGVMLVDWYTTDDPANPQNWSSLKKAYVVFLIL